MSFLLDIIIILIISLTIILAVKRGFVKTAISAVAFILAIIITVAFTPTLADVFLYQLYPECGNPR